MNYIGSKSKLSPFISSTIHSVVGDDLSNKTLCDIFAGTGIIARTFKSQVKQVIANDIEYYSYVLNKNYIENHVDIPNKETYIDHLNVGTAFMPSALPPTGFIYNNYCQGSDSGRQYFSDTNGKKIDTIRQQIEKWYTEQEISPNIYYFLLTSLLESADKVANTASVYGAFLKHLKKTAQKELVLQPANYEITDTTHQVFCENSQDLITQIEGDILYLDPPYNARQYGANYHILNTIARYDDFTPMGKSGMRAYQKSFYCSASKVRSEFEYLVRKARFPYIFLSYNNEGLMPVSDIRYIMSKYGKYDMVETDYQRFKADKTENRVHKASHTKEYLHILVKNG